MVDGGGNYIWMADNLIDKIKHLVEIEENVFTVLPSIPYIRKLIWLLLKILILKKPLIENIFTNFNTFLELADNIAILNKNKSEALGKIKWKVTDNENIMILQILTSIVVAFYCLIRNYL